ncbi:hypothetical protein SAMN05421505_12811 [Sinosporangium album]|uniref:ABC-2 type transport system ATP-binding protein n=1 Tax=Sinosporangium album TaxID=504805 RepID=A0A1G8GM83_9ACTN|nr:hypothetical protein [Sinosporangium album]SDH95499.1 hypothetical protein SAMN05421505_12811 [Sinosporangium album]
MAAVAYDVKNLVKTYPRQRAPAVDGVTFQIYEGEIFGLLGDNGAGKPGTGLLHFFATSGYLVTYRTCLA